MEKTKMKDARIKVLLVVSALLVLALVALILISVHPWQGQADAETKAWKVTLVGREGAERILSYDDITSLPSYKGNGGFFTTVGVVYGPYVAKGVTLSELCNLVGGVTPSDAVMVSATDGYSFVFDYDQIMGDFITYSSEDLRETPHDELRTVLMYQQDGKPLSHEDGKPLRIAIVGTKKGLLVEGSYWVKWVDRIEVLRRSESGQ
jgi:DMSO/TMAO reductase YedYZ molybdopterin-dependent catalytic subunit